MKRLSAATVDRLVALPASPGWSRPLEPADGTRDAELRPIVDAGELEAALWLVDIGVKAPPRSRARLFAAADELVRAAPALDLLALDDVARVRTWQGLDWRLRRAVGPPAVPQLADTGLTSVLGLAALNDDGHVREAAVRALSRRADPLATRFLLLRANDWVDIVHELALAALHDRLARDGAAAFASSLDLVFVLARARRRSLAGLVANVVTALAAPESAEVLDGACRSPSRHVRRACVPIAIEADTLPKRAVISRALRDADPVVRKIAASRAAAVLSGEDLTATLEEMLANTSAIVREVALEVAAARDPARARQALVAASADPRASVRYTARWLLRDSGLDFASFYRDRIDRAGGRETAALLDGLREVSGAQDLARAERFLDHPLVRVRVAAVRAVGVFGGEARREDLWRAIFDRSSGVARAALRVLEAGPPFDAARLLDAARSAPRPHTRRAAVRLMFLHDFWKAGLLLLRVVTWVDADTAAYATRWLKRWIDRSGRVFLPFHRAQLEEYEAAAASLRPGSGVEETVRALLQTLRIRAESR